MRTYNPFSLEGKRILVTGASGGIGRGIAIECSKMGADLIITGRNKDALDATLTDLDHGDHICITTDLSSSEGIAYLISQLTELDGIVHCAGIGDRKLCKTITSTDINNVMKINFVAPVLLQKEILKKKLLHPEGSVVFIASRAPFSPTIGNSLYSASKGAIISYAKVLALELAKRKIRVNCICPAMVWTNLVKQDELITGANYCEEEKKYPLGRYGQPSDIAYLAVYLLSNCSKWMTGSIIDITGGANTL